MKSRTGKSWATLTPSRILFLATGLLLLLALAWPQVTGTARGSDTVASAWERAREAGAYRFSADVRQTTIPQPTVRNVGRASKTQAVHLEGETDLPAHQLHLTLWSQGGSVLDTASGVEIRVDGERAYARQGTQDWQEINNFAELFAPQGDFMAFLAAARNVQREDTVPDASRFTFDIDGRAYAAYLRDQMTRYLAERGELPPGVELDLPKSYVDMTGDGELWLDAAGYPLRQILRLRFPPRPDEHEIHAEVTVDFDFSMPPPSSLTLDGSRFTFDPRPRLLRPPHPPFPLQAAIHRAGLASHRFDGLDPVPAIRPSRRLCQPSGSQGAGSRGPRAGKRHAARPPNRLDRIRPQPQSRPPGERGMANGK